MGNIIRPSDRAKKVGQKQVSTLEQLPTVTLQSGDEVRGQIVEPKGEERWVPVKGWEERYQVSSLGRVKSLARVYMRSTGSPYSKKERFLRVTLNRVGMGYVKLIEGWGKKKTRIDTWYVHRLVATHFVDNPDGKTEVNHKDGNRLNNVADNLEWATRQENMDHAVKHLLLQYGERHWKSKLTEQQVKEIRKKAAEGERDKDLAKAYEVSQSTIYSIVKRINWSWLTND